MFPLELQVEGDALAALIALLPYIAVIILVAACMMWFLAFMSRYFEYLKTLESRWLDRDTLGFVHRVLEVVWIASMAILVLGIAQTQSPVLREGLVAFLKRVPSLFFALFVIFIAALVVRILHRFAAFLRGELKVKPKRIAPPRALAFTEVVLKYLIYAAAVAVAVLGAIRTLPAEDQTYFAIIAWPSAEVTVPITVAVLLALLVIAVADRFVNSIFEDMKRRTKKFTARVVDEFKSIARYAVWLLGAIVLVFVLLDIILTEERLVIFAIGFVAFLLLVAVLTFDPVRNALAGVTLMRADPFDVGDRVKIGADLVCDVVSMSLTLTQVRTLRGERATFPNAQLLRTPIVNFSRSKPYAMSVEIGVGFEVGHDRVRELLVKAARETAGIVPEPPPAAFTKDVRGDAIVYQVLAYTDRPERMKETRSELIDRIQDGFAAASIRPHGGAA